jgi:CrcB protein
MSLAVVLGIGAIGGLGAIDRFLLDGAVASRLGRRFPFGTLAVNLSGSFVLGLLVGVALSERAYDILGTGFIGAFTTFSTWALESHRLGEDGQLRLGALNFAVSLVLGVLIAWAGRELGAAL